MYVLGQMNMYMRDCTDGVHFAAEYTDVRRPQADNQTYCERKGDTGTYCVRMCRGDFCNGPHANSASKYLISGILWIISVFNFMFHFQEVHHWMWHLLCQYSNSFVNAERWYAIYNCCFEAHVSSKLYPVSECLHNVAVIDMFSYNKQICSSFVNYLNQWTNAYIDNKMNIYMYIELVKSHRGLALYKFRWFIM